VAKENASLKFELDHRGSLAVLNVLSDCKMNLTKYNRFLKIETPNILLWMSLLKI
jgi:prephenate dehydratase